jgi:hypothetical protein
MIKVYWREIIRPNEERLSKVLLMKYSTMEYLHMQHEIVLIIKINISYVIEYS